jgi:two-component system, chemotaxis family, chemotaxis protein CheY
MRALIVEDDSTSGVILEQILSAYGHCDMVMDGKAAVAAFRHALSKGEPYDLICMDIMLPRLNGQQALQRMRKAEEEAGIPAAERVNVFMTTALKETNEVAEALYKGGAAAFFIKPINVDSFTDGLRSIGLI